jgi:5-methylcytosine-specific restriction endonuclease McrA
MLNRKKKLKKEECEICGERDKSTLDFHHIIPRTDPRCTNDSMNLAIICSTCHRKSHSGSIEIVGVFPSTKPPNGRTLVFKKDGKSNLDIDEPYCEIEPKSMRFYGK